MNSVKTWILWGITGSLLAFNCSTRKLFDVVGIILELLKKMKVENCVEWDYVGSATAPITNLTE